MGLRWIGATGWTPGGEELRRYTVEVDLDTRPGRPTRPVDVAIETRVGIAPTETRFPPQLGEPIVLTSDRGAGWRRYAWPADGIEPEEWRPDEWSGYVADGHHTASWLARGGGVTWLDREPVPVWAVPLSVNE